MNSGVAEEQASLACEDTAPGRFDIDVANERYPYCIVWSPLPMITWFLPMVGHMGITDSRGVIYDFAGPYMIGEGRMAFGAPTRYLQLDPKMAKEVNWDDAVRSGNSDYSKRMHNICCDNCHSHVARCLCYMNYSSRDNWNMFMLGAWVFFCGPFISLGRFLQTWVPFMLLVTFYYSFM
jgi:hypothetical protein